MNVKFCGLCRLTMIPLNGVNQVAEQCSGPDYRKCTLIQERHEGPWPKDRCPCLSVGDVHYCALAPTPKLIPCNQTTVSRCTNDGHKYCRLYLAMAEPGAESPAAADGNAGQGENEDQDLEFPMPGSLAYAPNHMWLDEGDGRTCHVGVDAFFGHALGKVDEVIFPRHGDNRRPMVRFNVGGVDFDLTFPNVMQSIEINEHLMADPSEMQRDPYGKGWLFEGTSMPYPQHNGPHPLDKGLLRGAQARRWMHEECDRLAGFVHEHLSEHSRDTGLLMQDGGRSHGHLSTVLNRPELIRLHSEFFTLRAGRTES